MTSTGHEKGKDDLGGFFLEENTLWGPIKGAQISGTMVAPTASDEDGRFAAIRRYGCDKSTDVEAKLRYFAFDPQGHKVGTYRYVTDWPADCIYVPECSGPGGSIGDRYMIDCGHAMGGIFRIPAHKGIDHFSKLKMPIDVAVISGKAVLRNESRQGISLHEDVAGDIPKGDETAYAYFPPAFLHTPFVPMGVSRITDKAPDFSDQGLLKTISQEDIDNTDIYIYRTSNNQLITAREGLADHDFVPQFNTSESEGVIAFEMMIRGPASLFNSHDRRNQTLWAFKAAFKLLFGIIVILMRP